MSAGSFANILGTGSYLPQRCVTNAALALQLETSDEWIVSRTGIRQRHIAADGEQASDLALFASQKALTAAGIRADQIGLIIVATTTPDMVFPSTACILQHKLGAGACPAFDIQAVCCGFIYALDVAEKFIRTGTVQYALVVGTEVFSRLLNWQDRSTCVLFGDGAGAVVLGARQEPGWMASLLKADGDYHDVLNVPAQIRNGTLSGSAFVHMDGKEVFKFAVKALGEIAEQVLQKAGVDRAELKWLIPHQANLRIIEATAQRLDLSMAQVIVTIDRHGNTSAASVPLALDDAVQSGRLRKHDLVLLEGIGGGLCWGAILLRWSL